MHRSAFALLLLLPIAAAAETRLPAIVVSATGYPISAREALVPVEVFERPDIDHSNARDLGDLLRLSNGLELGRNGGPGQATSLFFRGTDSDHNLVLVNGVPINSATVASAALQHIDTQLLQRVEVVKGPQSTLWGSGAIGGVVSVETLGDARPGVRHNATLEIGEGDSRRLAAGLSYGAAATSLIAGVSHYRTDGIPVLDVSRVDSGHDNTTATIGVVRRLGGLRVEASHWQASGTTEYQAFTFPPPQFALALEPVSQDFTTSASALRLEWEREPGVSSTLQLSLARDHIDQNQDADFAHTDRVKIDWRHLVAPDDANRLLLGLEAAWEEAVIESFGAGHAGTTDYQALYAQYEARRRGHRALAGIRVLHHEDAGDHATWNLGYGYAVDRHTILKANAATGFRFPTAVERYVFSPNPDLRPERSRAVELGLSHRIGPDQQLELSLFRTRIRDLIVSAGSLPNTVNVNINRARIQGVELAYSLYRGPWSVQASLLAQDARDQSNDRKLPRRADLSAKLRIHYSRRHFDLGSELLYSDERDDVDGVTFAPTTIDDYALVNLHGSYRLDRGWSLFGRIDNLLDSDYELVSRYNTPGRTLSLGIRYETD